MIKIVAFEQAKELAQYIDSSVMERIASGQVERFENLEHFSLLSFDWYDISIRMSQPSQLIIYFSEANLFFFCEDSLLLQKVTETVKEFSENDRTLFYFFSELMKPDMDVLEKLEDEIAELENNLLVNSKTQCAKSIVFYRKELIRLKKYYEQLNSIFEDITANENRLISPGHLRYFTILDNRVDRLFSTILNLRDFVTQVREAYQAQIDIEQNRLMKVFTVVTSVFLPLTLIVGWYGMNLQMPEFSWTYGYPMVIGLCIAVCIACVAIFKKKKWF